MATNQGLHGLASIITELFLHVLFKLYMDQVIVNLTYAK